MFWEDELKKYDIVTYAIQSEDYPEVVMQLLNAYPGFVNKSIEDFLALPRKEMDTALENIDIMYKYFEKQENVTM